MWPVQVERESGPPELAAAPDANRATSAQVEFLLREVGADEH